MSYIDIIMKDSWERKKVNEKITSAYANKWLKSLEEDKEYWINKEEASSTYVAAINEEPVIPEYAVPEYRYVNYDLDLVKQEYERVSQMSWNCRWHWINITRRCSLR